MHTLLPCNQRVFILQLFQVSSHRLTMFLFNIVELLKAFIILKNISMIKTSCVQTFNIKDQIWTDCSNLHLTYVPRKMPTSTTHLTLSHNRITNLTCGIFAKFRNLIYLDISNNTLKKLDINSFNGLNKLQVLNISSNYLSSKNSFCKGVFKALSLSLVELDIRRNMRSDYPDAALKGWAALKKLKLDCIHGNFLYSCYG